MPARHGSMQARRVLDRALPLAVVVPLVAVSSAAVDAVLLNQALAVALAGMLIASLRPRPGDDTRLAMRSAALAAALAMLVVAALVAMQRSRADAWPLELGVVGAAMLSCIAAARLAAASPTEAAPLPIGMAFGWWIAGLLCSAIALVQYFVPSLVGSLFDGAVVASSGAPGRAVGNMRQPNHLATALVCAAVWTAWLAQRRRLPIWTATIGVSAMVFAVALSASRTGALSLGVLLLWAAVDRRLPRGVRWLLALTPLIYAASWFGLAEWAALQGGHYYGAERLQTEGADPSSSRFAIWKNALTLIAQHPWTGVGWGHFNFAWTFTPFPDRPRAFFDHTHNLPLQGAVEIGVPAMLGVLGLLLAALWLARSAWSNDERDDTGRPASAARPALVMLAVLGVHSMLEYPLWYAYFLLPATWALGLFIGAARPSTTPPAPISATASNATTWVLRLGGLAMIVGSLYTLWDHRRIEAIFVATPGAAPLAERIANGQRSRLFGHHADYAAVTNEPRDQRLATFRRPLLQLVDVRLLIAYIEALKASGDDARALYAAQRLREFKREDAQAYFKACDGPAPPFQCEREPVRGLTWREMLPP